MTSAPPARTATAAKEVAAGETLPAFNSIGAKIEWRLERDGAGKWHPFATILRFLTDAGEGVEKGQFLVVTVATENLTDSSIL